MSGYELSRAFWDFSFANPEKVKPIHISIYFFAIEHCNRLGWKEKFGLPTSMVLEAIGVKSYSVFKKGFDELVEYGFIEVVEYSKNQYSSNIIALKDSCKAHSKALDKAMSKHIAKHSQSTLQSNSSIDKPITLELNKPITEPTPIFEEAKIDFVSPYADVQRFVKPTLEQVKLKFAQLGRKEKTAIAFFNYYEGLGWQKGNSKIFNWGAFANNWEDRQEEKSNTTQNAETELQKRERLLKQQYERNANARQNTTTGN